MAACPYYCISHVQVKEDFTINAPSRSFSGDVRDGRFFPYSKFKKETRNMCVLKYVLNIYHAVGLVQVNGVVNMCVNTCKW